MRSLLELSGHTGQDGPPTSGSVLAVLDTDIEAWPVEKLREMHSKYDIHIVPKKPRRPMDFDIKTCQALGINIDQLREVHGKCFQFSQSRHVLIVNIIYSQSIPGRTGF